MVDAKVHQLDFSLERIFLSLKEITVIYLQVSLILSTYYDNGDYSVMAILWQPDPLTESLEAVIGHNTVSNGTCDTEQPEDEVILVIPLASTDFVHSSCYNL